MRNYTLLLVLFSFFIRVQSQSVDELKNCYSGLAVWNAEMGVMTFQTAGYILFEGKGEPKQHFWDVPANVKTIIIEADVRVTGAFHSMADCTIKGKHRITSVVYGTDYRSWAQRNGVKAFMHCQFQNFGGTLTLQNLSSVNPFGFHVRGEGNKVMVSGCNFLDTRDGSGNHSDGFEAGDGSVVEDCYFETGDDVIKVYSNITVKNCTIKMIRNAVPIQLGWGNTGNDTGNFYNLTIIGESGRGNDDNAIIVGRAGTYTKTINIYGGKIENHNAAWVCLREPEMFLKGKVQNAEIKVQKFNAQLHEGVCTMTICGEPGGENEYNCLK